jgi:hypothetical protein
LHRKKHHLQQQVDQNHRQVQVDLNKQNHRQVDHQQQQRKLNQKHNPVLVAQRKVLLLVQKMEKTMKT